VGAFLKRKLSKETQKQAYEETSAARRRDMTLAWWHPDREPPTEGGAAVWNLLRQKLAAKKRKRAQWQDNDPVRRRLEQEADEISSERL